MKYRIQHRDILDLPEENLFNRIIREAAQKHDAFLKECFEKCGISENYILKHTDEFSATSSFEANWATYKWKGDPLFTIYMERSFEEVPGSRNGTALEMRCQYCAEFYPGKKIKP